MAEPSLKEKTVSGVGWSATDAFLGQGVTFIVGLVLARILSPAEYGLIGIVTIFTTVLTGIVDSGFSNALIRKQNVTNDDYNTMFITNMVISVVLFLLLFTCAPLIANFFERPELVSLTRVTGSILIIQALSLVQNTILTKRIDFKTKTVASLISAITSGIVGIVMAFTGFGVWALVGQLLSKQLIYTICLWILNRWWPSIRFSLESFKYMWGFGWKLLVSGLLNNIWGQTVTVVVGKCYSPATLGQYSRACEYARIFSSNLTSIVQRVTYPVLAEVQDDKTRMVSAYRRVIKTTMLVTAVIMISMGAIADPMIYCLIGPQWHQAATFLPLICIGQTLYPLHAINLNMLQVQGRSDIYLILEIVKKIIAIVPICLGIFVSIYWMLIVSIFTGIIAFFLNSYFTGKSLGYSSWMQLKDVAPSYGLAFLIAMCVYFIKYLPISYWIILPIQICVGVAVFFLVCEKTQMEEYVEVKGMVKQYLSKIKRIK
jgi:O-antigen/teichoic acid export membrane protein